KKEPILLGNTSAEECAAYIFGINWENLFSKRSGQIGFGSFSVGTPTRGMALHAALSKMPEATHAIQPRFDTTTKGWVLGPVILFGQQCTSVKAVGVKVQ
ncbi:MAG: hypothetical protein VXZ96_17960, partial [Myxococcota bacterium]|nr:hypothetical protein [Myxococcota bacterium]